LKWGQTARFKGDVRGLSDDEKKLFADVVKKKFVPAAEKIAASGGKGAWPASLRVKSVQGAPGILEMTWSFSGPDGRATFEWRDFAGESGVFWRRVGYHDIFKEPTGEKQP
jgi:hypothetical protein